MGVSDRSPPETLYHYTSNRAFLGMLKSRQIWLSNIRFLNDSQEFRHAGRIIARTITTMSRDYKKKWIDAGCRPEVFDGMVRNMSNRFSDVPLTYHYADSEVGMFPPFVFCLSERGNSLSQWRAYGGGEYCIGFDANILREKTGGYLLKVEYMDKNQTYTPMRGILDQFFENHLEHILPDGSIDQEVFSSGADDFEPSLRREHTFVRIKDGGFDEEEEWRLVRYVDPSNDEVFFDDRARYPIPRAKVKIFEEPREIQEVIKEIRCGPGADMERARYAFEVLKRKLHLTKLHLSFSDIPFRTE